MKCPNCQYEIKVNDMVQYGQPMMFVITPDQDIKHGKDYIIGKLGIAHRWRSISVNKYYQISIRAKVMDGLIRCEIDKMASGDFQASLYIFEFTDAWVICSVKDIEKWLSSHKPDVISNNDQNMTAGAYIPISNLPHLLIAK